MVDVDDSYYTKLLQAFDNCNLADDIQRRGSYSYLYDYFQLTLSKVGEVMGCLNSIKHYQINGRWGGVKARLDMIKSLNHWDKVIRKLSYVRNETEHKDRYFPKREDLDFIRSSAESFREELIATSNQYYKKMERLDFLERFKIFIDLNINEAEMILFQLKTEGPNVCAPIGINEEYDRYPLGELQDTIKKLKLRMGKLQTPNDISEDDLIALNRLIKTNAYMDGRTDALLQYSICPKCGGKVRDTEKYSGESSDGSPTKVHIRTGCEDCDFVLNEEIIDI